MNEAARSIRHNLTRLTNFRGRDTRLEFWPYASLVIGLFIAAVAVAIPPEIADSMARMQRFASEHPELATIRSGPGSYSISIEGRHPELMPDMQAVVVKMAVAFAVAVALLAAAVARRLHDRGKSGWWGVMPIPFVAFATVMMPKVFGQAEPDLGLFLVIFLNNLLYLASLALLLVFLVGEGRGRAGHPATAPDA